MEGSTSQFTTGQSAGEMGSNSNYVEETNEVNGHLLELQDAFVQALSASGELGKIRAQLRAVAIGMLRADSVMKKAAVGATHDPSNMSTSTQITLLLVQDFLAQHHLNQTAGVLAAEAGTNYISDEAREQAAAPLNQVSSSDHGSALEALVAAALSGGHGLSLGKPQTSSPSIASPSTVSAAKAESPAKPSLSTTPPKRDPADLRDILDDPILGDTSVQKYLDHYEDSLPYSDAEGSMDDNDYDEVEVL